MTVPDSPLTLFESRFLRTLSQATSIRVGVSRQPLLQESSTSVVKATVCQRSVSLFSLSLSLPSPLSVEAPLLLLGRRHRPYEEVPHPRDEHLSHVDSFIVIG